MKYIAHVPVEQYGFLGFEEFEGTAEEAWAKYLEIRETVKVQPQGLSVKEYQAILDDLVDDHSISGDPGDVDEKMSPQQKLVIQELKKSIKRITK